MRPPAAQCGLGRGAIDELVSALALQHRLTKKYQYNSTA
jgi:hypothetical protein